MDILDRNVRIYKFSIFSRFLVVQSWKNGQNRLIFAILAIFSTLNNQKWAKNQKFAYTYIQIQDIHKMMLQTDL